MSAGSEYGGSDARRVAGVDAGLLDVLHHAADDDRAGLVGDDVDVELDRVVEELVDEQREADRRALVVAAAAARATTRAK